jgi:hypothetical protein
MWLNSLRRIYKYIGIFLFFLLSSVSHAQFEPLEEDAYEPDSLLAIRNALKFDPVQIIFGDYQLFYERILTNHLSFEAGAGFTRRNYGAGWFDYSLDNLGDNVDINTGYSFTIALRYYLKDSEELLGPYVSAGANFRNYLTTYSVIDTTGVLTGDQYDDERIYNSYYLTVGYSALPTRSNLFMDFFVGIALRQKDFTIVKADDIFIPETYYIDEENTTAVGFQIGARIGFGF